MSEKKELRGFAKYIVEDHLKKHNKSNTIEIIEQPNYLKNAMYYEENKLNEYKKQKKENISKQDKKYILIIFIISIIFIILVELSNVNKLLYLVFIIIPISSIWYYFYYRKLQKEKIKDQIYNNIYLKQK